jgi:hypothetical protein
VLVVSTVSRSVRATELWVSEGDFIDQASAELSPSLVGKQAHIVPMKARSPEARAGKSAEIRRYCRIDEPLAFVRVNLLDNRSEFLEPLGSRCGEKGETAVITSLVQIRAVPGVRRHQTGDQEMRAVFPANALEQVAGVIRAKRWGGSGRGHRENLVAAPGQTGTSAA